ncbi:MAG TPA: hypothetical protein DCE80_16075 [Ignavibacteriales bacterium]|nr:hypothetical protein [Ignavibacteriales bacterium]
MFGLNFFKWKFKPNNSFLIYCHHGSRSFYACTYLLQQGFKEIYNWEGRIDAWLKKLINQF